MSRLPDWYVNHYRKKDSLGCLTFLAVALYVVPPLILIILTITR